MGPELSLLCFLDVRQRPGFVEDWLLWSVEAEESFKALARFGREPVRNGARVRGNSIVNQHFVERKLTWLLLKLTDRKVTDWKSQFVTNRQCAFRAKIDLETCIGLFSPIQK
jgi:hypothetical protein